MDRNPAYKTVQEKSNLLRHRAEQVAKKSADIIQDFPTDSHSKLIHELRVHQVELEMQNEELRRSQLELQEARDRYSDLYDFAPIGYFTHGEKGRVLETNITFANMLGQTKSSLLQKPITRFIASKNQDRFYLHCKSCVSEKGLQACEVKMKKDDNTIFYALLESVVKNDHDGSAMIRTAVTDISSRKQMEEELENHRHHLEALVKERTADVEIANSRLLQAQKMEAVGTLTAGISHDFNNILQTILGFTQILLTRIKPGQSEYNQLAGIEKAALRASDLVKSLLTYSRKGARKQETVDLKKELNRYINLLKQTVPKMIHIEQFLDTNIHSINADPVQIEQIILNLGLNARDAMPEGGKLIFETKNVTLDEKFCKVNPGAIPGIYVLIKVTDTGQGMENETVEHIFEPFYSTKEKHKGAGLGLAMVYGIVKGHGGYIACNSEPGQGTSFSLYFPAIERVVQESISQSTTSAELHGNETILLVDDEETLLDIGQQTLNRFGYTTLTAENGEKAIECYKANKNQIDLVILDLSMPGMGGYQCFKKLITRYPNIKVIIASGYSAGKQVRKLLEKGARAFIGKPYQITEIPKTVREVLDEKS